MSRLEPAAIQSLLPLQDVQGFLPPHLSYSQST